jgi:heme/copper-type cytochrome/quinol oxidase subunit 3
MAVQRGDRFHSRGWLAATALFGLIFLGLQAYDLPRSCTRG